jgi:hypothetical protein
MNKFVFVSEILFNLFTCILCVRKQNFLLIFNFVLIFRFSEKNSVKIQNKNPKSVFITVLKLF